MQKRAGKWPTTEHSENTNSREKKKCIEQTNYVYLFIICMNLGMCKCVLFQFTLLLTHIYMHWLKVLLFCFLFFVCLLLVQENISYEINGFDKHKQHKMNAAKCFALFWKSGKISAPFHFGTHSHQFGWLHEFCAFVEFHKHFKKKLQHHAPNSLYFWSYTITYTKYVQRKVIPSSYGDTVVIIVAVVVVVVAAFILCPLFTSCLLWM